MKPIPIHKLGAAVLAANAHLLNPPPPTNRIVICAPGNGPAFTNIIAGQIPATTPTKARKPRQPTKTENAAMSHLKALGYTDIRWNAITFKLANGHRYTPDLVCVKRNDVLTIFEVKGSYRLGSLQRSRLAFDQARLEWPQFNWKWMERTRGGDWKIE